MGYMSPEILEGKKASTASDMLSYGVMLYKSFFGNWEVFLLPGSNTPKLPNYNDANLINLLHNLLQKGKN